MNGINLPPIEDIDVDGLASLPVGYRYELHEGNLVIMTPSTFWHKEMAARILIMLRAAGLRAFADAGIRGRRARDLRLPDIGVVSDLPAGIKDYSNLPGSAYRLVVEIVSENSPNVEYAEKARWYAEQGIAEYWIVDQVPDKSDDDAVVHMQRLALGGNSPAYVRERTVRLSELEQEYRTQ